MISDDPDEDADNLDDEDLLGCYLEAGSPAKGANKVLPMQLDWPGLSALKSGFSLDHRTLAWFQANHADWRLAIELVLRAWIDARTSARSGVQP